MIEILDKLSARAINRPVDSFFTNHRFEIGERLVNNVLRFSSNLSPAYPNVKEFIYLFKEGAEVYDDRGNYKLSSKGSIAFLSGVIDTVVTFSNHTDDRFLEINDFLYGSLLEKFKLENNIQ